MLQTGLFYDIFILGILFLFLYFTDNNLNSTVTSALQTVLWGS